MENILNPWRVVRSWAARIVLDGDSGPRDLGNLRVELIVRELDDSDDPQNEGALRWHDPELGERVAILGEDDRAETLPNRRFSLEGGEDWHVGKPATERLARAA